MQSLRLERDGRELPLLAVMETDGVKLTLVGLTPAGQRLVTITWEGDSVSQAVDPNVPARIDGQGILRDVVFAHWPEAALQASFAGTRWSARFAGPERTLLRDGRPWITVKPGQGEDGAGLVVDHVEEGYKVHAATVEESGS